MCNIAGYVGERRAAPILIEMLRRQEGLNAGFFTGIATIHEGKLHYRKLEGELQYLLDHTDAADLPGNVGIIHGRTPGGGGDKWAHPFIGTRNGVDTTAMVVNGSSAFFKKNAEKYNALAAEMLANGANFPSRVTDSAETMRVLPDGSMVHASDMLCQLTLSKMNEGQDEATAMASAMTTTPSEIVSLMLSIAHEDRIFWSMISKPMMRGVAPHGTYLATCAIAFPEDAGDAMLLPYCHSGYVTAKGFTATAFTPPSRIGAITPTITANVYARVIEMLTEGHKTLTELVLGNIECFGDCDTALTAPLVYEILYDLNKQGRLLWESGRITHRLNKMDAPCFYFTLK